MTELMTMAELVERTGFPRTSIHFYLREGLLPRPLRTRANRAFYTAEHARLLGRIKELKNEGLALADIRAGLANELAMIDQRDVDLVRQENERVRATIVRVATEEFLSSGYEQARIADIIRRAGVNTKVFYSLFPSKAELLVECFKTFVKWNVAFTEEKVAAMERGERLLWRMHASDKTSEFSAAVVSLLWSENPSRPDLPGQIEEAHAPIVEGLVQDFESALKHGVAAPVPLELLAYSMIGAKHNSSLRASWDNRFSREAVIATHVWLFMTVLDALNRQTEPDPVIARYRDLIREVAALEPESPPAYPE